MTLLNQIRPLEKRKRMRKAILELIELRKKNLALYTRLFITPQTNWLKQANLTLKHQEHIENLRSHGLFLAKYLQESIKTGYRKMIEGVD